MVNVLIIDDEEPVRDAIRILGDWRGLGVERLWEAADGRSGLALLSENKIDLAVIDMKMPELNGVELLKIVERDHPDLLTIIVSGYNDFEYARQAIRSKVVDYLLKPVNREDLNLALGKAVNVLAARREIVNENISKNIALNMSLPKLKEKIYLSLLERSPLSDAMLQLIGADNPANRFVAASIRIMNLDRIAASRFDKDIDLLHFAVGNVINELAGDRFQCFSMANPKKEREVIAIITLNGGYPDEMAYRSVRLMDKISHTLEELFGLLVAAGIGGICTDAAELSASYESAVAAVNGIDLLKLNGTAVARDSGDNGRDTHSLIGRIPLIRGALENGNTAQARKVVGDLIASWRSSDGLAIGQADRALREFVIVMNDQALELKADPARLPQGGQLEPSLRGIGISLDYVNMEGYESLLLRILDYYGGEIRRALTANRSFEIGDIKAYIDDRYFEDIKISRFAEKYYMSREYLMKLFKQQYGYGIHEYVQKVRMDKARRLLDDPDLKIQEISAMLGYKDKNYFSKAFRNYYAVSPTEYREGLGRG